MLPFFFSNIPRKTKIKSWPFLPQCDIPINFFMNVAKAFRTQCPPFTLLTPPFCNCLLLILIVQIFLTTALLKVALNECQVFEMQSFLLCQIINAFWHDKEVVQKKRSIIFNFRLIRIYNKKSLIFYHMQHGCAQILNVVENRKMCQKMVRNCQNCLLFSDICYCYCLKKEYKNGKVSSNIWPGEWVITKLGIADLTAQCLKYLKKSPFTTLRATLFCDFQWWCL